MGHLLVRKGFFFKDEKLFVLIVSRRKVTVMPLINSWLIFWFTILYHYLIVFRSTSSIVCIGFQSGWRLAHMNRLHLCLHQGHPHWGDCRAMELQLIRIMVKKPNEVGNSDWQKFHSNSWALRKNLPFVFGIPLSHAKFLGATLINGWFLGNLL